jgi:hypothetical protein
MIASINIAAQHSQEAVAVRGGSRFADATTADDSSDEPVPTLPTTRTRPFIVV